MTIIPSNEIKKPLLHADPLGYTFVWRGHFLRGIFPQSVVCANSYFESGFIDEVVNKGLFPKTWISDFENEQFAMIIEHEMISPILYSTEWNFSMLKDAALVVLEIAQVAWKYGYNMIDCHTLNVLYQGSCPIYVDLGSFVPKQKGESWKTYGGFLRSYYYVLKVWNDGAWQIAKRMMAPAMEFREIDYLVYNKKIYRYSKILLRWKIQFDAKFEQLSNLSYDRIRSRNKRSKLFVFWGIIVKVVFMKLQMSPLKLIETTKQRIIRMQPSKPFSETLKDSWRGGDLLRFLIPNARTVTMINNHHPEIYDLLINGNMINRIVSINEKESFSNYEYDLMKNKRLPIIFANFRLLNNSNIYERQFPQDRLSSDIVIITDFVVPSGQWGIHNSIVFFNYCCSFSTKQIIIVNIPNCSYANTQEMIHSSYQLAEDDWFIKGITKNEILLCFKS